VSIGRPEQDWSQRRTDSDTRAPQSNPQGTIAFVSSEATDVFGTCTLAPRGGNAATCSTSVTPAHVGASPHGITATFTPTDTAHSGSSNTPAASLTVNKADQTITFAALANKTYGDAPFTVSATGGASGNPVTFTAGAPAVCTAGGTNGSTITITGAGTCTVTAQQAGNSDYNAAADVRRALPVNKAHLTVKADDKSKTYDGAVFSPFTDTQRVCERRNGSQSEDSVSAVWRSGVHGDGSDGEGRGHVRDHTDGRDADRDQLRLHHPAEQDADDQ
jgi:hypothetical protein